MRRLAILLLLTLGVGVPAWADSPSGPQVVVEHPWARATLAGTKTGAIYMTLDNKGGADDQLVGASTPVASHAQVHEMILDNGVMKMRPVAALDVKAGGTAVLAPGKYHVMLTGLKHPLKPGDNFPLTLRFAKSGTVQTTVAVEVATATGSTMSGMTGMSGDAKGGMSMGH